MKRACVIGWPIAHSRSPLIHAYWFSRYGIDGSYTKEPVEPQNLKAFLESLQVRGFEGCNVSVPHKEAAFALAEIRNPSATAIGAANTLWFENGRLACTNTDSYGFAANLDAAAPGWRKPAEPVVVLGAGGSARAIIFALLESGHRDIRIFNRSPGRAEELARHFGRDVTSHAWADRNASVADAAVIVNTTSLGMNGEGDPGVQFANARKDAVATDLVYVPLETAFLRSARANGLAAVDGLGMLLHQAVPGFEKWFGVRPEVTPELYALVAKDIGGP